MSIVGFNGNNDNGDKLIFKTIRGSNFSSRSVVKNSPGTVRWDFGTAANYADANDDIIYTYPDNSEKTLTCFVDRYENIEELNLLQCDFINPLPPELFNRLVNLKIFNLARNRFTSDIDLTNCPLIEQVRLGDGSGGGMIGGSVPNINLTGLTNVTTIYANQSGLESISFEKDSLLDFRIHSNSVTHALDFSTSGITRIQFNTGGVPSIDISGCTSLTYFNGGTNPLTAITGLNDCTALTTLLLGDGSASGKTMDFPNFDMSNLSNIVTLYLNNIGIETPTFPSDMPDLERIRLHSNSEMTTLNNLYSTSTNISSFTAYGTSIPIIDFNSIFPNNIAEISISLSSNNWTAAQVNQQLYKIIDTSINNGTLSISGNNTSPNPLSGGTNGLDAVDTLLSSGWTVSTTDEITIEFNTTEQNLSVDYVINNGETVVWDFGDGTLLENDTGTHNYASNGTNFVKSWLSSNSNQAVTSIDASTSGIIGTFDIAQFDQISSINLSGNNDLTNVLLPVGLFSTLNISNCNLSSLDFTDTNPNNNVNINLDNNILTSSSVNEILVYMDNDGATNGIINLLGTNSAPDGSSGGFDGLTAKSNLQSKGWTVNTN